MERRGKEQERERQEWNEMYQALQREISALKHSLQEKEQLMQMQATLRRSVEGGSGVGSFVKGASGQFSPQSKGGQPFVLEVGSSNNQVVELQEQLRTKEEEIKILWNVIKEINKSKGTEKVNMEQLKHAISQKIGSHTGSISSNF